MTYRNQYEENRRKLESAGVPEPEVEAGRLLEAVCGTRYGDLFTHGDRVLTAEEEARNTALLTRRCDREPLAYLLEEQEFMGLTFHVTPDVLIPNPDTETLVEEALRLVHDGMRIMDLCTGSGCVALSILRYTNDTTALGTDISAEALAVARENAQLLGMTERFDGMQCDLFPGEEQHARFDMIVSNPPYIETAVIDTLEPEVARQEPWIALDGGADGLGFYRRIVREAAGWLYSGGMLLMEIGESQGPEVMSLMQAAGFSDCGIIQDYNGKDRVVTGCWIDWKTSSTDMRTSQEN
ncbi:MAG: peptide chain release factor N(5)-glutamine methyltransferase [Butyrivibrio sp.]|nr:peptide chain release factor N(5)-glutamine methyltransferase [Butyrivibrio sp.]